MARHHKKRINNEKAKAGQHRDNLKGEGTSVKQRVAALDMGSAKGQANSVSRAHQMRQVRHFLLCDFLFARRRVSAPGRLALLSRLGISTWLPSEVCGP